MVGEIVPQNDSADLPDCSPSDSISNMLSENLAQLEISDKFSVFYRIIDFYAFLHTVATRDLTCRPIVYVYFILCMLDQKGL